MPRRWLSPLRYPGGKARLADHLAELYSNQLSPMEIEIWMEPFAGGAGAALTLLEADVVCEAWLVERNPGLAAFWSETTDPASTLIDRVANTMPTVELYQWASDLLDTGSASRADLAYAAFLVNRCSRSGIVAPGVGPIGGKHQSGRWTVASRFDGQRLAARLQDCQALRSRIRVMEGDGIARIENLSGSGFEDEVFLFVDPPYVQQGNRLYAHGFGRSEHERLQRALLNAHIPWVLTYDADPLVERLYAQCRRTEFTLPYSAAGGRVGTEWMIYSDSLSLSPSQLRGSDSA